MGTRAMIRYEGKDFVATHWDGYPSSLGKDLLKLKEKSKENVLEVAREHSINFVSPELLDELNKEKAKELSEKHNLPISKIKKGYIRGCLISESDYLYSDINNYGDWAEYIYNIKDGVVFVAKGRGNYDSTKKAEAEGLLTFKKLTKGMCKDG